MRCFHCGKDLSGLPAFEMTLDHLTPRSDGGSNDPENLVTCCRACNCSAKQKPGRHVGQKDNASMGEKLALRRAALEHVERPLVVLETHAGYGLLGERLYMRAEAGVAFERREEKAECLVLQRPTWRVYESDSCAALAAGVAADLPFTFADFDPYGDPWPTITAFLGGDRARAPRLVVAVNDGLPQKLRLGGAWKVESMREAVEAFGNHGFFDRYLPICRWLLERKAAGAGYDVDRFEGRMGGKMSQMAHYFGVLTLRGRATVASDGDFLERSISQP